MNISLTWPGGTQSVATSDQGTALERLISAGVPMPNSCRRGDCQQCGCRVVVGQFIDRRQSQDGGADFHLACQIEPQSDLILELVDDPYLVLHPPRHMPAKIARLQRLSANVMVLALVIPRNQVFQFRPGQYLDIKLKSGAVRSYSIAAYDPEQRVLEFHIRLIDGGVFGGWLQAASIGELVQIYGPLGRFFLRDSIRVKHTFMVATGTGIAPIYCMLTDLETDKLADLGKVSIVWGNRSSADNYFDQPMLELCKRISADYLPVYSAEAGADKKGRVTHFMPPAFNDAQMFAAGHPQMIADLRAIAHKRGLPHTSFYADAFSFASPATERA